MTAAAAVICCSQAFAHAQNLTVRLLHAKSAKPLPNQNVTIGWDNQASVTQAVNKAGVAAFTVPIGATSFVLLSGSRNGTEPYRIAYRNCNKQSVKPFVIDEVLKYGLVQENICGKAKKTAQKGEVVFWALPRPLIDWQ